MKKIAGLILFLSLVMFYQCAFAVEVELEGAIARLWFSGPDAEIEKVLQACSENTDPEIASRAAFHLACLQIMTGSKEEAPGILARLEKTATSAQDKEVLKSLQTMLQARSNGYPANFQQKISIDFKDADIKDIVKIIAATSKANIVVHKRINDRITLGLKDATVAQAIDTICKIADLRCENNDGIFVLLPGDTVRENYDKREIRLAFLSPTEAEKVLLAGSRTGGSHAGLAADVMVRAASGSVILEGERSSLDKYEAFLQSLDKKGKAQKISFRIWKLQSGKTLNIDEFSAMDETARKKVADILAAPIVVTLPGKEATIQVGTRNDQQPENLRDSLSYSFACIVHETADPDRIKLIANLKVEGTSFVDGKKFQIKKESAPTLEIMRNKWVMLPIQEDKEILFLELQVMNHLD